MNRSLDARLRQLPGVAAAGATTVVPLGGPSQTGLIVAEGYVSEPGEPAVSGVRSMVTPGYFEAVGTRARSRPLLRRARQPAKLEDHRHRRAPGPPVLARWRRRLAGASIRQRPLKSPLTPTRPGARSSAWCAPRGSRRRGIPEGRTARPARSTSPYFGPDRRGRRLRHSHHRRADGRPPRDLRTAPATVDREVALFDVPHGSDAASWRRCRGPNTLRLTALRRRGGVPRGGRRLHGCSPGSAAQRTRRDWRPHGSRSTASSHCPWRGSAKGSGRAPGGTPRLGAIAVARPAGRLRRSSRGHPVKPWLMLLAALTLVGVAGVALRASPRGVRRASTWCAHSAPP